MGRKVLRTCKICGLKTEKKLLIRYVLRGEIPVVDRSMTMSGRGAYCCESEQCTVRFLSAKKKWNRMFRIKR